MNDITIMISQAVQAYYSSEYDTYQRSVVQSSASNAQDRAIIGKMLGDIVRPGDIILDIGAGSCQWLEFIHGNVSTYLAVDANQELLDKATAKYPIVVKPINCNGFDTEAYADDGKKCDAILFSFFFSHFSDDTITQMIKQIKNYLRPVIIIDSYQNTNHIKFDGLKLIDRYTSRGSVKIPKRYFYLQEIDSILLKQGFFKQKTVVGRYWFLTLYIPEK